MAFKSDRQTVHIIRTQKSHAFTAFKSTRNGSIYYNSNNHTYDFLNAAHVIVNVVMSETINVFICVPRMQHMCSHMCV